MVLLRRKGQPPDEAPEETGAVAAPSHELGLATVRPLIGWARP